MTFEPKSEKEIADGEVWPKGEYDFEVTDAQDKVSQASNEMIVLRLKITDADGLTRMVTDYLLAKKPRKFRNAAVACGLKIQYDRGQLNGADFKGATGILKLGIERARNGYPRRNAVMDYVEH